MRKAITTIALTGALAVTLSPTAEAAPVAAVCGGTSTHVTHATPPVIRTRRMRRLIRCVFDYYGLAAQIPTALYVADRESNFIPWAKNPWTQGACRAFSANPYGSCGTYQHLARYWAARVRAYLPHRGFPHWPRVSPLSPRANVIVTARMVKSGGWGPWSL